MAFFRTRQSPDRTSAGPEAPVPENEVRRLAALRQLRLLDTAPEDRFNRLTRLTAAALRAPIAILALVDETREWWKSAHGWNGAREFPRARSFGAHAIAGESRLLVVRDASNDPRFAHHPLVSSHASLRFFAGQVLTNSDGFRVGILGVLDHQPRDLPPDQQQALSDLVIFAEQELRGIPLRDTLERLAQAERRAEEQHARFAAFMEHLPNVAFLKDAQGRTLFGNRYYEELFGVRLADTLGKRDDEWLPPEVAAETMHADDEVIATGRSLTIEEEIPTILGPRHWLTFKFPVPTPSGERLLGGIAVDITTQKDTERQLQELLSLQHALVNSANVAIISTSPNGFVHTFNAAAERMLGYSASEVIDQARPEIWHLPEELERIAEEIRQKSGEVVPPTTRVLRWGIQHGGVAEHELNLLRKDGSVFCASMAITALWNGREITGYMAVIQDITARREFEHAQQRAKEEAEEANRAKSQFVANMSHEVRTPLNGILGVTAMLLETDLQPRQRELANFVLSSGHGLLAIVNDILDFSKVEAGRLELENIDFDLAELLRSIRDLHHARAAERGLNIEVEGDPALPTNVHGDPVRLRQVLNNLVDNARKFSENGTIRVKVSREPADEPSVVLKFEVIDCGIGIPADQRARIFEPFTQADVSTTRLFGGTGLGLSICRQLVELMGGHIGVESEPGRGSDFWFTARFLESQPSSDPGPVRPEPERRLPDFRVLVAEDSAINRLVTTHQLQKLGCQVEAVENGREALLLTESVRFDLILMDCQMPVMDGYAATAAIRERERNEEHRTRIIAVTANAFAGERERCLFTGMDGYLSKPFQPEDLYTEICHVMQPHPPLDGEAVLEPLDRKVVTALRKECAADGDELFARYVQFLQEDISHVEEYLATADPAANPDELRRVAHRLRGAASNFGARPLMDACANLERSILGEASHDEMTTLLAPLEAQIARAKSALGELAEPVPETS